MLKLVLPGVIVGQDGIVRGVGNPARRLSRPAALLNNSPVTARL